MAQQYFIELDIEKMNAQVRHDDQRSRFYFSVDGREGELQYKQLQDGVLDFQKTYLDENLRGRGWSKELVKEALDYARAHQVRVKPTCPLVKDYITAHPEYQSIRV